MQSLDHDRLVMFETNDPAVVRELAVDAALAGRVGHRLDWTGTWELATDMPFYEIENDPAPLEVIVRFELPAPIRVEKLLMAGLGLSRAAVHKAVGTGRIRLPMAVDARARADFAFVIGD